MKQQQQYTKQTTNTLQQKQYNKTNKAKNQLRLRVFTLIQMLLQQVHFL